MEEKANVSEHQFSAGVFFDLSEDLKILTPVKKVLQVMINCMIFKHSI